MRETASVLPLSLEGLGYAVGGVPLLSDVHLTIRHRRRLMILGPNGAGKSLLLRLCHGLLTPTSGTVRWSRPERASKAQAMVFQRPTLLRRSARANIVHALALRGVPWAERVARAEAALARFGLTRFADRRARLMSGGEQQRLSLALAWSLRPEILFLDEPTAQLDPTAVRAIETMVAEISEDGMTIVMATHDLGQARRLGEDVAFLNKGRLIEAGPAAAFFRGPRTAEARAFLAGDLLW